jgi:integrase/recombinase XerD
MSTVQPIRLSTQSSPKLALVPKPPCRTNRGRKFPPDPLTTEEIVRLLGACIPTRSGPFWELSAARLRAIIVLLWRTGLRISEALALEDRDLHRADRMIVVRRGKGGNRRLVMMDEWGWKQFDSWLAIRRDLPLGPVFCVLQGDAAGQSWADCDVRRQFRDAGRRAGLRKRVHPHVMRHTHAIDLRRDGLDLLTI